MTAIDRIQKMNAKQLMLCEFIADPMDHRTNKAKAESAGLSEVTYYRMVREPEVRAHIHKRTTEMIALYRPLAYKCLIDGFKDGDRPSARDFLSAIGDIGGNISIHTEVHTEKKPLEEALPAWRSDRGLEVKQVKVKGNGKGRNGR